MLTDLRKPHQEMEIVKLSKVDSSPNTQERCVESSEELRTVQPLINDQVCQSSARVQPSLILLVS